MSLKTFPLNLSATDQTVFQVPVGAEGTAHNITVTGTGNLTLKYFSNRQNTTYTILSAFAITDIYVVEKSLNFEPGDKLIASGDTLKLFASVYFVGGDNNFAPVFGPGPQDLIGGDMINGFFGELTSQELFTNQELDYELGFTQGTPMSDAGFLKFARNNQIIYVQKRPMRYGISWDHIYSRGCVYGTNDNGLFPRGTPTNQYRPLNKNNFEFVPRLLTGAASDPIDTTNFDAVDSCTYDLGAGSEWNELIYRIHQDVPICGDPNHDQYHGGPQVGGNWATYTNGDLGIVSGNGRGTWTQEQASDSTSLRVRRGSVTSVARFFRSAASNTGSFFGLRLVLALKS